MRRRKYVLCKEGSLVISAILSAIEVVSLCKVMMKDGHLVMVTDSYFYCYQKKAVAFGLSTSAYDGIVGPPAIVAQTNIQRNFISVIVCPKAKCSCQPGKMIGSPCQQSRKMIHETIENCKFYCPKYFIFKSTFRLGTKL